MSRAAVSKPPQAIMESSGPVQAEPDRKFRLGQEAAPRVVQENPVGLQTVADYPAGRFVPSLQINRSAIKIKPGQGRLPAVPGKANNLVCRGGDLLDDDSLEKTVIHQQRRSVLGRRGLPRVIAVNAAQVAGRAGRLDENLEIARKIGVASPVR